MKRIKLIPLAITMLLAVPAFLTSCQEDAPEINYTMSVSVVNDFTKVVEAIDRGTLKNEEAIAKLADAIDRMSSDQQAKLQAIRDVLGSVNTTLETRLVALEAALKAQTLSMEGKLDLIRGVLADQNATLETRLAAIDAAMRAQTLSLEGKLDLLLAAVGNQTLKLEEMAGRLCTAIDNLSDGMEGKLDLIRGVLADQNTTLETRLAAVEAAMRAQTLSLEGKLDLLLAAVGSQTLKLEDLADRLTTAIDNLSSDMKGKLDQIKGVLADQNTTLETRLAAVEAAMKAQTLSLEGKLDLLEAAVKALPDYGSQLAAISTAIANLPDYGDKLSAIEAAVKALPDYGSKFDLIVASLDAIKGQAEALGTGQTGIASKIADVTAAINALVDQVKDGDNDAAAALAQIIQKLEDLKGSIGGGGTTPSTMEYVDLGLPSGLKWAKCNLGASKPSDYGDYYAWGETAPKAVYDWTTYKWMQAGKSDWNYITKYTVADGETGGIWYDSSGAFIGDGKTTLVAADDAATANLGSPWRMPTEVEIKELRDNCTWIWTTQDGMNGYQVDGPNGNAIFLPASGHGDGSVLKGAGSIGYYWSSSIDTDISSYASYLYFDSDERNWDYKHSRKYGQTIRPVRP